MVVEFNKLRATLRDEALTFPDVTEDFPWGERVVKVKKKVFAFLGRDTDSENRTLTFKLPASHRELLSHSFAKSTGYGLGKSGWVSVTFGGKEAPSLEQARAWLRESYCAVAPKSLAAELSARATPASTATKPRATKSAKTAKKTAASSPRTTNKPKSVGVVRTASKRAPKR